MSLLALQIRYIYTRAHMSTARTGQRRVSGARASLSPGDVCQLGRPGSEPSTSSMPVLESQACTRPHMAFPRVLASHCGSSQCTFNTPSHFLCPLYTLILFFCSVFCLLTWFYRPGQHFRSLRTPEFNSQDSHCVRRKTPVQVVLWPPHDTMAHTNCISPAFWRHNYIKHDLRLL